MRTNNNAIHFAGVAMLIMVFCALGFARQEIGNMQNLTKREREIAKSYEKKYLDSLNIQVVKYSGEGRVDSGQVVAGHVEIVKGTLRISGQVQGTVLALFSDVELDSSAVVAGNLVCVNGKVWRKSGSSVHGDLIESYTSTAENIANEEDDDHRHSRSRNHKWPRNKRHLQESDFDGLYADYNRVDGLTLGLRFPQPNWWERKHKHIALIGKAGYAFVRDHVQYQLGLERWLFQDFRFTIGAEVHDFTDSEDRWIIDDTENALAAALIREDFHDYYLRKGYKFYLNQNLGRNIQLRAEYRQDDISDLPQIAKWSLFGGKKNFRSNPTILPIGFTADTGEKHMELNSVLAFNVTFDTRDQKEDSRRGWYLQGYLESGKAGNRDFYDFSRAIIDLRRYQPLGWEENLSVRLRAGSSTAMLLPMYWFDLGGLSTLRGYGFKSLTGNRMVLANAEYRINTFSSDWFILDDFDLILFVDSGYAWFTQEPNADRLGAWPTGPAAYAAAKNTELDQEFDRLTWNKLKTNVGIGLADRDGDFRIDIAKPTDHGAKDFVVTLRLQRSF